MWRYNEQRFGGDRLFVFVIVDNIVTVLILVGLDENLQMSIYRNYIKPDIS